MYELLRNPDSFYRILDLTVSTLNLKDMMTHVVAELRELFGCDRCTLYVVDAEAGELYTQVAEKCSVGDFRMPIDRNGTLAGFVAVTGRDIKIDDVYDERQIKAIAKELVFSGEMDRKTRFRTKAMISVPLKLRNETIGVLQGMNKPGGFLQRDLNAMKEFSLILALALNNALAVEKLLAGTGGAGIAAQAPESGWAIDRVSGTAC